MNPDPLVESYRNKVDSSASVVAQPESTNAGRAITMNLRDQAGTWPVNSKFVQIVTNNWPIQTNNERLRIEQRTLRPR